MASSKSDSGSDFSEKSWHLLSLLLRIGHPVLPQHLASTCKLFPASRDFVLHVTSLPSSPIFLAGNGFVTPSPAAFCALGRFFSVNVSRRFMSGIGFRAPPEQRRCCSTLGKRKVTDLDVVELVPPAKRRLFFSYGEGGTDPKRLTISHGVPGISLESYADAEKAMTIGSIPTVKFESQYTQSANAMIPLHIDTNVECLDCLGPKFECRESDNDTNTSVFQGETTGPVIKASDSLFMTGNGSTSQKVVGTDKFMQCNLFIDLNLPACLLDASVCNDASGCSIGLEKKMDHFETSRHEYPEQNTIHPAGDICKNNTFENVIGDSNNEYENAQGESGSKKGVIGIGTKQEKEDVSQKGGLVPCGEELQNGIESINHMPSLNFEKEETVKSIGTTSAAKQILKSSCILKGGQKNDSHAKLQVLTESLACNVAGNASKNVDKSKNDQKIIVRHKMKQIRKENVAETTSMTPKGERKAYPSFETFNIEEEEGSGGYGTVYRARRKTDGKRLAIKCPHNNAHKNHINNERNMLERFGGKSFIIKFEGSFKTGSNDCFVLEHVEHDRPEVLKREIDIIQLQWYGYCLFRALATLHKEGVVHRDVKPGNFLFSRKLNKGYLIDFNLAMDLKQKYNIGSKSKPSLDATSSIPLPSGSSPLVHDKNPGGSKPLTSNKRDLADYKKNPELNRHVKQKAYAGPLKNCPDRAGASVLRAQGTDGSGITSAKDGTSTRTVSAERLREPLPFKGRKELISLVQNSMQCASNSSIKGPSSQRKRIIAPSGKVDGKHVYLTPMPLHSSNILRSKVDVKHKREGSCVGTKGFRAPEVLFRSQFQGPKVDIWSAGVTLLYFVLGKAPFAGEPEQNIKEIARLRGCEDLWEVAKLHDRDLSFPVELFDERYLQSWDIESWCKHNTKRPEFLEHIPKSLYDLIDKCLTVNPRNRISVEEVLRHEFFASCNELLRKQRMIRRGLSSDIATSTST